jgi:hypothetical protein
MDYETMSFQDLKIVARDHRPKIKGYYLKSKAELIRLLTMDKLPDSYRIEKLTVRELQHEAKDRNFPNIWNLSRSELIDLLYPSSQKNDQDDDSGKEHDYPKKSKSKKVGV